MIRLIGLLGAKSAKEKGLPETGLFKCKATSASAVKKSGKEPFTSRWAAVACF